MSRNNLFSPEEMKSLGIIQGWKSIGHHLGVSARTARRWYDNYKLPVHYSPSGRAYAIIAEVNKYMSVYSYLRNKHDRTYDYERAAMMRSHKKKN